MRFEPLSRHDKIANMVYAYFGEMAGTIGSDAKVLTLLFQLMKLPVSRLVLNENIVDIQVKWNRDHPEELDISNAELQWIVDRLYRHLRGQIHRIELERIRAKAPNARLRLVSSN